MSEIRGVGIDLCGIERMRANLEKDSFLNRCFTEDEIGYIRSRGAMAADSLAGLWAAKEAVVKALGCGLSVSLKDIRISHSENGQPLCTLSGAALLLSEGGSLHISITHEGDMASAICVWSV